jgi:hypothetical protein
VISPYGLQLHEKLQGTVPPFRDSVQTAQFAATLAAFDVGHVNAVETIEPRRFEIGNGVAVDVSSPPLGHIEPLHPWTVSESRRPISIERMAGVALLVAVLFAATVLWPFLRRLTWEGWSHSARALEFTAEDIGGHDGADALLKRLPAARENALADWLKSSPAILDVKAKLDLMPCTQYIGSNWTREDVLNQATQLVVDRLNLCFDPDQASDGYVSQIAKSADAPPPVAGRAWRFWAPRDSFVRREKLRRELNRALQELEDMAEPRPAGPTAPAKHELEVAAVAAGVGAQASASTPGVAINLDAAPPPSTAPEATVKGVAPARFTVIPAARAARSAALDITKLRCKGLAWSRGHVIAIGLIVFAFAALIRWDAFMQANGEPFSLTNGVSAWPAQIVRGIAFILAVVFAAGLSRRLHEGFLVLTRGFRFLHLDDRDETDAATGAQKIWNDYGQTCRRCDWKLLLYAVAGYVSVVYAIDLIQGGDLHQPVRGELLWRVNIILVCAAVLAFSVLAFMTIDAALNCRRFIVEISERASEYSAATRRHFSRQLGGIDLQYLDEWIDLQLIAELTERVGRLVYYPTIILLLLMIARNSVWDAWTWPAYLIVIFALNFGLALASVIILQRAARDAKRKAEESLDRKVKRLRAQTAPSHDDNNAKQAEQLLADMRLLRRGAFVPFWENPVVGAIFLSSGGTTALQLLTWSMVS